MNLYKTIRLGNRLIKRIAFFETVSNENLASDGKLAMEWVKLELGVIFFRRNGLRLKRHIINYIDFAKKEQLFERSDLLIHRILASPEILLSIYTDKEFAETLEERIEKAIWSQAFTKAIPQIAKEMAETLKIPKN